jgi:hypothetical protein
LARVIGSIVNINLGNKEDIMSKRAHPKVRATKANCEADSRAKEKLADEFEEFKEMLEKAAKSSPEVKKLIVPLAKLERAIIIGAHGRRFEVEQEKKQRALQAR